MTKEEVSKEYTRLVEAIKHFESLSYEQKETFKVHMARVEMLKALFACINDWKKLKDEVSPE